jgi:hypothetical protein
MVSGKCNAVAGNTFGEWNKKPVVRKKLEETRKDLPEVLRKVQKL